MNTRIGSLMQLLAPIMSEGGGKVNLERWLPQRDTAALEQKGTVGAEQGLPCAKGGGDEESCGGGDIEHATVLTLTLTGP